MAITNYERVGKAIELLKAGLRPYVERELKAVLGPNWEKEVEQGFAGAPRGKARGLNLNDPAGLISVMINEWHRVFSRTLGNAEKNAIHALREVRNKWAHSDTFSTDEAYRAIDSIGVLLAAVSAPEAEEIEKMKMDLLRTRFEDQRRTEVRRTSVTPLEGKPAGGLRPWREIVTPHPDVASGRYQQAEFAADLWQVYLGEGTDEYRNPTEFFRRTFITDGLRQLLKGALQRLSGSGGDPVIELQTNFGGGKTHSMLALYHLFSGASAAELPGIEPVLQEAGATIAKPVRRAVLVGTRISPGQPHKKPDGTVVRTLWGEIAWQLGGKEGYKLLKQADETASSPGDALRELFNKYAPCLILVDEWVAYARQLHDGSNLPAGTFDTQFTFAQTLSESAKGAKQTLLVVSVPASDNEIGGQWGQQALARIKNAIGRVESSWRPASQDEGFEIVRRRLFTPIADPALFPARDAVCRAFSDLYGTQHQEFPSECREASYERRMLAAYPIHPEVFDRLYNDWSTLDKFQRTRGVLRLMAAVIHSLWDRQDGSLLILPSSIPVDDPRVQFELTRYMDDPWVPVIEKDVDGPHSLPLQLDRENPNLGRYSACRRVARTVYLGSAPTIRMANRGLEDGRIKLGCVQPGESVATFGDALRRLSDKATHLYVDDAQRYWFATQPTVTRLADERAEKVDPHVVIEEMSRRLREAARSRGDFAKVHPCPPTHGDIPDEADARLVIIGPEHPHAAKDESSAARVWAAAALGSRGSTPRNYRNALVFLAADATRLKELEQAVRQFLAWNSIVEDARGETPALNLDSFQMRQAQKKRDAAQDAVEARIPETYIWLLVPGQSDPKGDPEWSEIRLMGQDALAVRAAKKLKGGELLLTQMGGIRLRLELDKVPLWRGNHVSVKMLAEDFAKYLYLPRLRDNDVLLGAIRDGVAQLTWSETFAYAERWDEPNQRYLGLKTGQTTQVLLDVSSVVVKPDMAARQLEADRAERDRARNGGTASMGGNGGGGDTDNTTGSGTGTTTGGNGGGGGAAVPVKRKLTRFHGAIDLDTLQAGRDAAAVGREVIGHLAAAKGAKVRITLEIEVELADGASDDLVRTVTENCRTMKFKSHGFEEE